MSGNKSRRKGIVYELKIRQDFIRLGYTDCNTSRYESKKRDDQKVDLCNTGVFNIQCKAVESGVNYHRLLAEMPKDGNYNLVFHKKDRKEVVAMTKETFLELMAMLIANGIIKQ